MSVKRCASLNVRCGRRVAVRETTPKHGTNGTWLDDRVRYFAYDGESNILQRREGTVTSAGVFNQTTAQRALDNTYAYVGGQQVASGQRSGKVDVLSRLTAYDSSDVGTVGVTVQTGDTLRGIAQRVYGNSNLWYVLAQANAIETDADLVPGTSLKVPEVKVTANDANTFKPFNPGEAIGNTAPSLPYIEPPPQNNCNMLAAVVMIVIAVVVTYFTAGAAANAFYGVATSALSTGQAVVVGAVAGAAGAAASNAAGSAMGATSFSWRNVAAGAVSGAVTGGVVGAANGGALGETLQSASWARAAAFAVVGNVAGYGANRIAGNQASFSWKSVAASAVSGAVSGALIPKLGEAMNIDLATAGGQAQAEVLGSIVGGVVGAHTRRALLGEDLNYGQIVMDAFGNALGNALNGKYSAAAAAMRDQGRTAARQQLMASWQQDDEVQRQRMMDIEQWGYSRDASPWSGQQGEVSPYVPGHSLDDIALSSGLSASERSRLASTTIYDTHLVDPHLIERNDGSPDRRVTVHAFRAVENSPVYTELLPDVVKSVAPEVMSWTEIRQAGLDARKQSAVDAWNDTPLPFMRVPAQAGYNFVGGLNSLMGVAIDPVYGRKLEAGIGYAFTHPGAVKDATVQGIRNWWDTPGMAKLEGAATFATETLASGGGSLIAKAGTGLKGTRTLADVAREAAELGVRSDVANSQAASSALHARYLDRLSREDFASQALWKPSTQHGDELVHHAFNRHPSLATTDSGTISPALYDSRARSNILNPQSEVHSLGGGRYAGFNPATGEFTVFSWQGGGGLAPGSATLHSYYIPLQRQMTTGIPFKSQGVVDFYSVRPR